MADPFTIATSVIGLLASITTLSVRIGEFGSDMSEARKDMQTVTRELEALASMLPTLRDALNSQSFHLPSPFPVDLAGMLQACNHTVVELETLLHKSSNKSMRNLQWALSGKRECAALKHSLEAHKSTINMTLMFITAASNNEIQNKTGQILSEISHIRRKLPSGSTGIMLERYLEDSASYVESVYEQSVLGSVIDTEDWDGMREENEGVVVSTSFDPNYHKTPFSVTNAELAVKIMEPGDADDPGDEISEASSLATLQEKPQQHQDPEFSASYEHSISEQSAVHYQIYDQTGEENKKEITPLSLDLRHQRRFSFDGDIESIIDTIHPDNGVETISPDNGDDTMKIVVDVSRLANTQQRPLQSHPSMSVSSLTSTGDQAALNIFFRESFQNFGFKDPFEDYQLNIWKMLNCIDSGVDVNVRGGYFGTALQAAAQVGDLPIVSLLLDRGAEVNTKCGGFGAPLQAAAHAGHYDIVCILLDHGSSINAEPLQSHSQSREHSHYPSALAAASKAGHIKVMELLIMQGADINGRNEDSPFWHAVRNLNLEAMQLLHEHGADTRKGSPLSFAAGNSKREAITVVHQLLKWGADVNQTEDNETPLISAVKRGSLGVVKLLLEHGANPNLPASKHCVLYSTFYQYREDILSLIELLVSHGAAFKVERARKKALSRVDYAPNPDRGAIRDIFKGLQTEDQSATNEFEAEDKEIEMKKIGIAL